jgi:hypothetical protein
VGKEPAQRADKGPGRSAARTGCGGGVNGDGASLDERRTAAPLRAAPSPLRSRQLRGAYKYGATSTPNTAPHASKNMLEKRTDSMQRDGKIYYFTILLLPHRMGKMKKEEVSCG